MISTPAKRRVFCAGIARNCEESLVNTISIVDKSIPSSWMHEWLVVESDSTDTTVDVLAELSIQRADFSFVSEGKLEQKLPALTERLAFCRNIYLQAAMKAQADFLLIVDLDGVVTQVPEGLIGELLEEDGDWTALFANQSGPYYDLAALRHTFWNPTDPFGYQDFLISAGYNKRAAATKAIVDKMLTLKPSIPRIEVQSAFGGMALYKLSDLPADINYLGLIGGRQVCEHVPLNESLVKLGRRLFIEPRLIIARYTEHTYQLSRTNRILAKILRIFVLPFGESKFESTVNLLARLYRKLGK
jgi:hypothetical protein